MTREEIDKYLDENEVYRDDMRVIGVTMIEGDNAIFILDSGEMFPPVWYHTFTISDLIPEHD